MKKVLSTVLSALVAVAFAGACFAAEPVKKDAAPAVEEKKAEEKAPAKPAKKKKAKKVKKEEAKKEEAAPAAAPAK